MSVTDFRMVAGNSQMFQKLYGELPADLVLEFFEKASSWEAEHALADMLTRTAEPVREAVSQVSALRDRAAQISAEFARFVSGCNATLFSLAAQLEQPKDTSLRIDWDGKSQMNDARSDEGGLVVFAVQLGHFHIVPILLSALGHRVVMLSNPFTYDAFSPAMRTIAPRLTSRIDYIKVPSPGSATAALSALRQRKSLVLFPEVNMGGTGNVQAERMRFLDRRIWIPTSAARLARITASRLVPMLVVPGGRRRVVVEVGDPISVPADRRADATISLRLFAWLEQAVLTRPHLWWCWHLLDSDMAVGSPGRVTKLVQERSST